MSNFTRSLLALCAAALLGLPYASSDRGWGIGSERNPSIVQSAQTDCSQIEAALDEACRRSHRSHHRNRSYFNGGPRSGK